MKTFESFDEREKAVISAGGNLAYYVLVVLLIISIYFLLYAAGSRTPAYDRELKVMIIIFADLIITLCVKYVYCWIHKIAKKIVIVKFFKDALLLAAIFFVIAFIVNAVA